jgi:hypothetical protein
MMICETEEYIYDSCGTENVLTETINNLPETSLILNAAFSGY